MQNHKILEELKKNGAHISALSRFYQPVNIIIRVTGKIDLSPIYARIRRPTIFAHIFRHILPHFFHIFQYYHIFTILPYITIYKMALKTVATVRTSEFLVFGLPHSLPAFLKILFCLIAFHCLPNTTTRPCFCTVLFFTLFHLITAFLKSQPLFNLELSKFLSIPYSLAHSDTVFVSPSYM